MLSYSCRTLIASGLDHGRQLIPFLLNRLFCEFREVINNTKLVNLKLDRIGYFRPWPSTVVVFGRKRERLYRWSKFVILISEYTYRWTAVVLATCLSILYLVLIAARQTYSDSRYLEPDRSSVLL